MSDNISTIDLKLMWILCRNYTGASSISNPFSELVIKAPRFNLIISRLTNNTYVLVVLPPGEADLQCARFNIIAARSKFARTDISEDTRKSVGDRQARAEPVRSQRER